MKQSNNAWIRVRPLLTTAIFILVVLLVFNLVSGLPKVEEQDPLLDAIYGGNEANLRRLLRQKPDGVDVKKALIETALLDEMELCQIILAECPNLSHEAIDEALCLAMLHSDGCTKLLIDAGANPASRFNGSQVTSLHLAAIRGNPEIVILLLEQGADPLERSIGGMTPLQASILFTQNFDPFDDELEGFRKVQSILMEAEGMSNQSLAGAEMLLTTSRASIHAGDPDRITHAPRS